MPMSNRVSVRLEDSKGVPLPECKVVFISASDRAELAGTSVQGGTKSLLTNKAGEFPLNDPDGPRYAIASANESGFCLTQTRDLHRTRRMVLQPWSRIEGLRTDGGQPLAGQKVAFKIAMRFLLDEELQSALKIDQYTSCTDSRGCFTFERVPPVDVMLYGMQEDRGKTLSLLRFVKIQPGETARVEISTQSRTLTGHLDVPKDLRGIGTASLNLTLQPDMDMQNPDLRPILPDEFDVPELRVSWWRKWYQSEAGQMRLHMFSRMYGIELHDDFTFISDRIEPGKYWMTCKVNKDGQLVGVLNEHVDVPPPEPGALPGAPLRVAARLSPAVDLQVGSKAPDFVVPGLKGQPLQLSAFLGRPILLDFWATWCGPCVAELPFLRQAHGRFAASHGLVVVSLSLDSNPEEVISFLKVNHAPWLHGLLGNWSHGQVREDFGVYSVPSCFLIGRQGQVLAKGLRGEQLVKAVESMID